MKPKNPQRPASRPPAGFTLVELLVVITIIVTLAALSLVGVRTIRRSAQAASCTQNLRTWGIAIHGYAAENNGQVQWKNWASIGTDDRYYEPHLGGDGISANATMGNKAVLSTQLHRTCPAQKWDGTGNGPVGYAMTRPDPKTPNSGSFNLSVASQPSRLLLMIDAERFLTLNNPSDLARAITPLCDGSSPRHGHKVNALFADGHVASYSCKDIDGSNRRQQGTLETWFTLK